jgi:calcineurin-like phosphoesterase family protein
MQLCGRPFDDVDEMNEALIENINATVTDADELYTLGDLSYRIPVDTAASLIQKIRCKRLHLIKGNHDKGWAGSGLFVEVCDYKELKSEGGEKIILFHYPIEDWAGKGHAANRRWSVHLHGHIHSRGSDRNAQSFSNGLWRWDVGADANSYRPIALDTILSLRD